MTAARETSEDARRASAEGHQPVASADVEGLRAALVDAEKTLARERSRRLESEALLAVLHRLRPSQPSETLIPDLLHDLVPAMGFGAAFLLEGERDDELVVTATTSAVFAGARFRPAETLGEVLAGHTVAVAGVARVAEWAAQPAAARAATTSALHLPIGPAPTRMVLVLTHPERALFSDAEVDRGERIARVVSSALVMRDLARAVEERRNLEQVLVERFRTLAEGAFEALLVHDRGAILLVNRVAEVMFGYEPGELFGAAFAHLVPSAPPQDDDAGDAEPRETLGLRKDGTTFPIEVMSKPGPYLGLASRIVAVRDLTKQKAAIDALGRSEAALRDFIDRCPEPVFVRRDGPIVHVNAALASALGYAAEELVGRDPIETFIHPDDRQGALGSWSQDAGVLREQRWLRKDGAALIVDGIAVNAEVDGAPARIVMVRDLTERRRMETKLLLSDRMTSVGTLAAGVAHELNNPLAYVHTNLELLGEGLRELASEPGWAARADELCAMVDDARHGTERMRKIVRGMKAFSRADEERRTVLEVVRVVEVAINLAYNEVRHRARLVKDYGATPDIEADEGRLCQVFVNLLVNAAQAIPEGNAARNEIRIVTTTDAAGRALVLVRDTGGGIPKEAIGRIFDPFFTTKPVGVGTGLGLSICHNIVTSLGGEIAVQSVVGEGTTVAITLPAAKARAEDAPAGRASPSRPAVRTARVLVIDDDSMVAQSVRRSLREHEVQLVTSARAALDRLLGGERFDVILCDLMMPEMTGMDLHAELVRRQDPLADSIIFITGGAFTPTAMAFLDRVPNVRLDKPVDAHNLRALVAAQVGRSA